MSPHLLIFFILIFRFSKITSSLSNETDHFSLIKFKESISNDPYRILDSWNSSTHFCNWHGISCGHKHRRVTQLVLNRYQLAGPISPFIGNLSFLRLINLDDNNFHGEIPLELGRLFRLQMLNIQNNTLTGEIPINVTRCSNLKNLRFGGNHLIGKIPEEIGSLHKLESLSLPRNNFTGEIPTSLWNLSSLKVISLVENNLEGSIPEEIGRLKILTKFSVGINNLSGAIPSTLYNLSSLTLFAVVFNQLNGSLPTNMFSNLPNLQILSLGENQFSGHIPTSIANSTKLAYISMANNKFVGEIPNLGRLHDLVFLATFNNSRLGSNSSKDWEFLTSLSNCSKLTTLALSKNNFGGHLPNTIGNLSTQLTILSLAENQIFGKIPEALGNLINLEQLEMELNHLTGNIPNNFGNFQQMQKLYFRGNKFSGNIPFIGNLTQIFFVDLSNNMLEGNVPPSVENCRSLQYLDLSQNNFSGAIPVQLMTLSSLTILLNLSHNSFSRDIPSEVEHLKNIGQLDVSHNHLIGNIPQTIGGCQSLEYLFLQGNSFQEAIPLSMASLKGLRYLDMSQNNLTGSIPKGLQDLDLEFLNVSFNRLDGEVPSKGVFRNASGISLVGNNNLCGGISELELPPCPSKYTGKRKHQNFPLILSICCTIAFVLMVCAVGIYHGRKRNNKSSSSSPTIDMLPKVSYQSLDNATDGFSVNNLIGSGSFGSVYKGIFESQQVVAIKVINLQKMGAHKSFFAECNALRKAKHRNLVKIITCCSSIDYKGHEFKALVYEYMVNGNLENWLHPQAENPDHPRILLIDQIINILIDIASALNYLHYDYGQPLIHCDLKPSNVLLDGNMVGHLSDFGLARLLSSIEVISCEQSSSIGVKGTVGYVPPEYGMGSEVSIYGDMYGFGILVLEMLTKRRPTEGMFKDGYNLQTYVKNAISNKLLEVVSPTILPRELQHIVVVSADIAENIMQIHPKVERCLHSLFKIGLRCSMESPQERMSAIDVIKELNSIKSFFPLW